MLKSRVSPGFTQFYEEQQSIDIVGFYVVAGLRVEWLKPIAQGLEPESDDSGHRQSSSY